MASGSVSETTPPLAMILMAWAPVRRRSRTAMRSGSGPSTTSHMWPWPKQTSTSASRGSPCPPVWLSAGPV